MSKGHGRVMGTGTLVHSLGSMNLSPMILSNQAKKLLNNKKLPKSLAVSFIFLTFATTFARVMGFWVMGTGTLVRYLSRISGTSPYDYNGGVNMGI